MITADEIKSFEDDIEQCFLDKKIRAPIHLTGGDEQQIIDVVQKHYKPGDWTFATWRAHGIALAIGCKPEWLKEEILAGHSMSICCDDPILSVSSIVGGIFPLAIGVAHTLKETNSPNKVMCWAGDSSCSNGTFKECLQYAENFDLPILFVVSDNHFSVGSPTMETWGFKNKEEQLKKWDSPKIVYYEYELNKAHVGSLRGWVSF